MKKFVQYRMFLFIDTICSQQEKKKLRKILIDEKQASLFRCWTRKEAYLKAIGTGMNKPMNQLTVSLKKKNKGELSTIYTEDPRGNLQFSIIAPLSVPGYEAALCTNKLPKKIRYLYWIPQMLEGDPLSKNKTKIMIDEVAIE